MSKPIAVLISDIHYNLTTLPLADAAMRQAITKANGLQVPLIVAGDLHDTKANMRAECVNAMIETFKRCKTKCYVIRGNHDSINEKSIDHSLNFLDPYVHVVNSILGIFLGTMVDMIPYHNNAEELKQYLKQYCAKGEILIMHQGITGSNSGEYIQDKSAITKDDVAGFRVISGHYHTRQTIDLPDGGKWDYIGNPYTLNYGEANDPEKGFQILMDDGSLEFVPTNLRKHIILNTTVDELKYGGLSLFESKPEDLIRVKVKGIKEVLFNINKLTLSKLLNRKSFRLDLIPTDTETHAPDNKQSLTQAELLDSMIDSLTNTADDIKSRLKNKWKDLK